MADNKKKNPSKNKPTTETKSVVRETKKETKEKTKKILITKCCPMGMPNGDRSHWANGLGLISKLCSAQWGQVILI